MNEHAIKAQINKLCEQRNSALNDAVNLSGELAIAHARIAELSAELAAMKQPAQETEPANGN